jgi:hypothetical protein
MLKCLHFNGKSSDSIFFFWGTRKFYNKRESKDQAVQEANNQAQELRIEQLEAELVELRALIKTKETL